MDDVIISNTEAADGDTTNDTTRSIIGATDGSDKVFTLDMKGHSLISGDYGSFVNLTNGSNNKVIIKNAKISSARLISLMISMLPERDMSFL